MKTKACLPVVTLSLIALLVVCGLSASAQDLVAQQPTTSAVPNLIRYGGVLKDADGNVLASQTVGITFALYKQQDGGVALWTETRNVTTDAAGQYNVMLGSTKTEGVPAELFSDQEQRWLAVQVQGQPEPTRALLVSVPYAFKAHEAETLGGLPPSAFVKAATIEGTGGASTYAGKAVNALSAVGKAGSNPLTVKSAAALLAVTNCATSTPNRIPLWTLPGPPSATLCDSVIYQFPFGINAGFVGVGTVKPMAQLDVNGGTTSGINTSNNAFAYMIGANTVLSIFGTRNLFAGMGAGLVNNSTIAIDNTFIGNFAGFANSIGSANTFTGSGAGASNLSGKQNTFYGYQAGNSNDVDANSFFGYQAGFHNDAGIENTFLGFKAGWTNDGGSHNTFVGFMAGKSNGLSADNNTFTGSSAGLANVSGRENIFIGTEAGQANISGRNNVFVGYQAGLNFDVANHNIFIGSLAGTHGFHGGSNIYIGNQGADESNTIRIGNDGNNDDHQNSTHIAGIYNQSVAGGGPVYVDGTGKLGTAISSRRFKEGILSMGDSSNRLLELRPVTFFYKAQYDDGSHLLQYGLIAEEVANVYPELAVYDKDGQPYSVKYQLLAPMLLNELQKQHAVVAAQQDQMQAQSLQIKAQQQQMQTQEQKMLAQQREIEGLKSQLKLQNAAFQERLSRLESLVTTQMQTAADKPTQVVTPATGGLR